MTTVYTPTAGVATTYTLPADGDDGVVNYINANLEAATDYLLAISGGRRTFPLRPFYDANDNWVVTSTGIEQATRTGSTEIYVPVPHLIPGMVIDEIGLYLDGNGAGTNHGSSLPVVLPSFSLLHQRYNSTTPGAVPGGSATDAPASVAAYEVAHPLTATSINHTVDAEYAYFLSIDGESGVDSQDDALKIYTAYIIMEAP